jgi:hypothetical protein
MFHPKVIEERLRRLHDSLGAGVRLREFSIPEVDEMTRRLQTAVSAKGEQIRALTAEEQVFVVNERIMSAASFRYWAERYGFINRAGTQLGRMYPLLETQDYILSKLAKAELDVYEARVHDGIMVNLLKGARQIGGSTLAESIAAYRFTKEEHVLGLIAADDPNTSAYMFDIFERFVEYCPWWMRPRVTEHVKNSEMAFETQAHIWVGSGKSTRGDTGKRGQLGRGRTLSFVHLSELSTWSGAQIAQIDGSLLPTLHRTPRTFAFFESTAKGRGVTNYWHQHWRVSRSGKGRFLCNIFIPWYVENRYSVPAPTSWYPLPTTIAHARLCEETSAAYLGYRASLSRAQLYWYESTREYYESKNDLRTFLEEYGSVTDDECFQHSGRSIFAAPVRQRVRDQARPLLGLLDIRPMREISKL